MTAATEPRTPMSLLYSLCSDKEAGLLTASPVFKSTNCALCEQAITKGYPLNSAISGAFTNRGAFRPYLDTLCPACALSFRMQELRRSSFYLNANELKFLKKPDIMDRLFDPPEPPFAFCVSTSYKKHMLYLSTLNYSVHRFYVQFEEMSVLFDTDKMKPVHEALAGMSGAGVSREALATGNYDRPPKTGLSRFIEWDTTIREHRGNPQLALLIYALGAKGG
ncbi:MAG: hypothetical protein JRN45_00660 [Nitrososphaerota archaeon]|nr:hypothetical protein [Nitrososphaerota archaeon]